MTDISESGITVEVDYRERDLLGLLPEAVSATLPVGDIVIRSSGGIYLLFERKTLADLAASRKDQRFSEQKQRMLAAVGGNAKHVTYIVEGGSATHAGFGGEQVYGLAPSIYLGMYIHTMYRDGIHVVFTKNVADTAAWIREVLGKCQAHPEYFYAVNGGDSGGYALENTKVKVRRSANLTPENVYLLQLSQFPGLSLKTAKAIAEKYPTWRELIAGADQGLLGDIPGLGKKRVAMMMDYFKSV